jgi:hypothetical protein
MDAGVQDHAVFDLARLDGSHMLQVPRDRDAERLPRGNVPADSAPACNRRVFPDAGRAALA